MLYKRLIWLKRRHPYNRAQLYIKNIFHFCTFKNSKLPKTVAKKTNNTTSFPCSVRPEKLHLYTTHIAFLQMKMCVDLQEFQSISFFSTFDFWQRLFFIFLATISCDSLSCTRLMLYQKASRELIPTTFPKQSKLVSPSASSWYWLFVHQRKYKNSNVYAQKRIYVPFQDLTFLFVA